VNGTFLLIVYFSNHEPDAIGPVFLRLLGDSKILVVENGSCDGSEELRTRLLNELSSGKKTPAQIDNLGDPQSMFRGFEREIGKAVYNTGKTIVLEDSPWTDKEGGRFLAVFVPPRAASLDEALVKLRTALDEGGSLVRQRDEAYASQLSGLVKQSSSARILAMMGSGHERAVSRFLKEKGVAFREVRQPSSMPSTYRSIALERAENQDGLSRLDLLRCLAEMVPRRAFIPLGFRGELLMYFWVKDSSEGELVEYLSGIYSQRSRV